MRKISLVAALSLGLFGSLSVANAMTLEEAIKGVTYSGLLRYRFQPEHFDYEKASNDERTQNTVVNVNKPNATTSHLYRAFANFETPAVYNSVSAGISVLYINETARTGTGSTAGGLGAGADGSVGVSEYYVTFAPKDYTNTTVKIGKQILYTPLTDGVDFDRGTGVLATNSDIDGLTLALGGFDTYSLSNVTNYTSDSAFTSPLYVGAAIYKIPNLINAQLWYFKAKGISDSLYTKVAYGQKFGDFGASASVAYAFTSLATGANSQYFKYMRAKEGTDGTIVKDDKGNIVREDTGQEKANDLLFLKAGVSYGPAFLNFGYVMNTKPGYSVSYDDQGKVIDTSDLGQTWWIDNATATSIGIGRRAIGHGFATRVETGAKDKLKIAHATLGVKNLFDNLDAYVTYLKGNAKYTQTAKNVSFERDFQEIVPLVTYRFNKFFSITSFYSMLSADLKRNDDGNSGKVKRTRFRIQTLYKF